MSTAKVLRRIAVPATAGLAVLAVSACSIEMPWDSPDIPDGLPPGPGVQQPYVDIHQAGRTADTLRSWADPLAADLGIPVTSMEAYGNAAEIQRQQHPECGIAWTTIAGIAGVETKHGTHRSADVQPNGDVVPEIRGPQLDGTQGNWEIRDTDNGKIDGDDEYDRAVGPFQFIPETWKRFGVDANGDGRADPDNIDDAALSAARYLCVSSGGDMTTPEGWEKAILTYNNSMDYVLKVRNHANAYSVNVRY